MDGLQARWMGYRQRQQVCVGQTPIVIAGGKKIPEAEALEFTAQAIAAGADGVDMGRNIFQSEDPVAMIQAVRAVVHEGLEPAQAYELYGELRAKRS